MVYKSICKKAFLVLAMTVSILLGAFCVSAETSTMVLYAPSDVTVKLYEGFYKTKTSDRVEVSATSTETVDGITYYSYDVEYAVYNYLVSGTGYYRVGKNINWTVEKAGTQFDVNPGKRTGNGNDPLDVRLYTDEVLEKVTPTEDSWAQDYPETFQTPYFTDREGKSQHQMTTNEEVWSFVNGLDATCNYMYTYTLATTPKHALDIPMAIFTQTDLSGVESWEDAAARVQANGKLTVHYQAHIHGNESAAGEASLAVIKKLTTQYGEDLLDKLNIYVIPVLSPDGAYDQDRQLTYYNPEVDPNRDMLRVETVEVEAHHRVMQAFQPELVVDSHEFTVDTTRSSGTYYDMMTAGGFTDNNGEAYKTYSAMLAGLPFDALREQGLRPNYYMNNVNGDDPNNGRNYTGGTGALYILLESRGIGYGTMTYDRRCVAHVISMTELLNYTYANAIEMQQVVDNEKARIVADGAVYDDGEQIVLESATEFYTQIDKSDFNMATGAEKKGKLQTYTYVAARSRIAPTAYVIPAGESWTQDVLDLMDKHTITYEFVPANSRIWLQQYTGTTTEATLTDEMRVLFPNGAYVFTKNQPMGIVLSQLMEPDVTDAADDSGTLAQSGMILAENSAFPIYRYIRDLNTEGAIDYDIAGANIPDSYVIYIDHSNGSNNNDGLTKDAPVKTVGEAYTRLISMMADAPADAHATLVLVNDINMADNTAFGKKHTFPVVVMGLTGTESINCNSNLLLNGPTTLQDLKLTHNGTSSTNAIYARGNALTIGENVTNVVGTGGYRFSLVGAANSAYSTTTASTNLTVKSGNWRSIYIAGYNNVQVTGNASLVMTGGSADRIAPTYNKPVGGNVTISLSNATINEYIFCGPLNKDNVAGNVSLTLGENVTAPVVWAGSRDAGNVTGDVTITVDGAQVGEIHGGAKNATGTVGSSTLVLKDDTAAQLADFDMVRLENDVRNITATGDVYLNLNGYDVTGTVTAGKLYGMDTTTNGYSDAACGYIANISGDVAPSSTYGSGTGLKRYLAITNEKGTSFHRIYVAVTGASITPENTGLNYKTAFIADQTVTDYINNTDGVVFGLKAQIAGYQPAYAVDTNGFTAYDGSSENIVLYTTRRTAIGNVMKTVSAAAEDIESLTNAQRAALEVTATAFVGIQKDGQITVLVESSGIGSTSSFQSMAEKADAAWTGLDYKVKKALHDMYDAFGADIEAAGWNVTNMKTEPEKA